MISHNLEEPNYILDHSPQCQFPSLSFQCIWHWWSEREGRKR